ncbi:MAG: hypothetical protein V2B18_03620 [Pseudomonadota bacterium]
MGTIGMMMRRDHALNPETRTTKDKKFVTCYSPHKIYLELNDLETLNYPSVRFPLRIGRAAPLRLRVFVVHFFIPGW